MPPLAIAGGAAAAGLASGIYGANKQAQSADNSLAAAKAAAAGINNVQAPDYDQMKLQLEQLKNAGQISPEQEQNILQDPTQFNNLVQENPQLKQYDLDALSKLSGIANSGGNDAQAQLANQQSINQMNTAARGARDANLQSAAARGASGSGLEFVANQAADQGAASNAQMAGLQNAAAANQRDLSALSGLTGLTSNMNAQDLQRQTAVANARDSINRFNTLTAQDTQRRNVAANNQAQYANTGEAQRESDYNTQLANAQQQYNKGLGETQYQDSMNKAKAAAGLTGNEQNAYNQGGQALGKLYGGLGQGLLGVGASYATANNNSNQDDYNNITKKIRSDYSNG